MLTRQRKQYSHSLERAYIQAVCVRHQPSSQYVIHYRHYQIVHGLSNSFQIKVRIFAKPDIYELCKQFISF